MDDVKDMQSLKFTFYRSRLVEIYPDEPGDLDHMRWGQIVPFPEETYDKTNSILFATQAWKELKQNVTETSRTADGVSAVMIRSFSRLAGRQFLENALCLVQAYGDDKLQSALQEETDSFGKTGCCRLVLFGEQDTIFAALAEMDPQTVQVAAKLRESVLPQF